MSIQEKHYDTIIRPVVTEKASFCSEHNKIVFNVSIKSTKNDIKLAVEALFGVKVVRVNTLITKGKKVYFKGRMGQRSDVKKAVITIADGQSVDVMAGL